MNAYELSRLIQQLEDEPSRTEKERLLGLLADDELGRFVLRAAYDPFVTYGITPALPDPSECTGRFEFAPRIVSSLLENLSRRVLTGNSADREVSEVMKSLSSEGARLLYLILKKDLKCGIAATTINQAIPGLIPVFSVMRAHHYEPKRIKAWPVVVEPKLDGFRYTFLCRSGQGGFFSRNGLRQASCDHLVEPMIQKALALVQQPVNVGKPVSTDLINVLTGGKGSQRSDLNFMVDGEMMAGTFNKTSGDLRRGEAAGDARFHIFDIMSYADFDAVGSTGFAYADRRRILEEFVGLPEDHQPFTRTPRYFAHSEDEIIARYEQFRAQGLEGAMVKIPTGLYDKKKSYNWLKVKAEETEDLQIVGFYNGKDDSKYASELGGVIVRRANGVLVRVGGGFSDELRQSLARDWAEDAIKLGIGDIVGFKGWSADPLMSVSVGYRLLGRLVEVEYHEETPDGSLRHPRFVRFRDDKLGEIDSKEAA